MRAGLIIMILGVLLMITGSLLGISGETEKKTVSCYDKYDNKINGVTCIDMRNEFEDLIALFYSVGIVAFLMGIVIASMEAI